MTLAPSPKKRIFKPLRSSSVLISLRNQPDDSGATIGCSFLHQLFAAAVFHPTEKLADLRAERYGGIERERDFLAREKTEARPGAIE
jgi:hypothetical protein